MTTTPENPSALGPLIRAKREREGLNIREAGEQSHVAFSTLARIENGATPSVKVYQLIRAWLDGEAPLLPTPPMTLRDWFAGQAIGAIITSTSAGQHMPGGPYQPDDKRSIAEKLAIDAFEIADALLAQRSKP